MELEVIESHAPVTTVEETVLAYVETPFLDRLLAPLTRGWLRRGNEKAMRRLGETLAA